MLASYSPMSFVRKKKNAESHDGVARHRKMKSAGSQTDCCLTADQRAAAWSDTICFGLFESVKRMGGVLKWAANVWDSKVAVRYQRPRITGPISTVLSFADVIPAEETNSETKENDWPPSRMVGDNVQITAAPHKQTQPTKLSYVSCGVCGSVGCNRQRRRQSEPNLSTILPYQSTDATAEKSTKSEK